MSGTELSLAEFGKTGVKTTVVGLGGEGILRTFKQDEKAEEMIRKALDVGIRYFDSARVYKDSERYYGSIWGRSPELRKRIFQTSKSASRDKKGALADLESSLKRLNTTWLDLWQIHDVRDENDLRAISAPGGALEAFVWAKKEGMVRNIGVTGHHDSKILTKAVNEWPVDAVLMPVNPVEEILGGFLTGTLPAARKKGIAVIGMKILGASHYILLKWDITPEILVRYALSHGITLGIVGCSSIQEVETLAGVGKETKPLSLDERKEIMDLFRPYARRMAFYRGDL